MLNEKILKIINHDKSLRIKYAIICEGTFSPRFTLEYYKNGEKIVENSIVNAINIDGFIYYKLIKFERKFKIDEINADKILLRMIKLRKFLKYA